MQRNFETLKTAIYRHITSNTYSATPFNLSALGGEFKGSYSSKRKENTKKLNTILDNLDIRAIQPILERIDKKLLPTWYRNKNFVIDYNKTDELDFIITK